jgi:hypothetical protein
VHLHRRFVHEDLYGAKIISRLNYSCFLYWKLSKDWFQLQYCIAFIYHNNKFLTIWQVLGANLKYCINAVSWRDLYKYFKFILKSLNIGLKYLYPS